jgi:cyanophycinase
VNRARALSTTAVIAATALMALPAPLATAHPGPHGGTLIIVGGGLKDSNAEIYNEIINKAGGTGHARIGVLTAASVTPENDPDANDPNTCSNSVCNGAYYANLFKSYGAVDAQWIPIDLDHITNADSDAVVAQVNSMTGFFFGGGDQYRYVTTLLHGDAHTDSKVLAAIRAKLADGAVVAGSSAGAEIASGPDMVTGGDSYPALRDGSAPGYFEDPTRLGYLPAGGFDFFDAGLIDTHTGTYGREGRAVRLAADTGHTRVFALDENTAVEVDDDQTPEETLHVLGTHGVSVFDLRRAHVDAGPAGWSISGVDYSYLTDGDSYKPRSWQAVPAPGQQRLKPSLNTPVPADADVCYSSDDPAGHPYAFSGTARDLVATTAQTTATATTYETGPAFAVDFVKGPHLHVFTADGTTAATFSHLTLDIHPQ